jgi:hypothetical protein
VRYWSGVAIRSLPSPFDGVMRSLSLHGVSFHPSDEDLSSGPRLARCGRVTRRVAWNSVIRYIRESFWAGRIFGGLPAA